jgi:putative ABC transport system ATP-binding protein
VTILSATRVRRDYAGEPPVRAVDGVSLALEAGEFVAVTGPSGCGKSTVLHLCGGMDRPSSGTVHLEGVALDTLDDDGLTRVRRERVGFVFQFFNLLPTLTVLENTALPLLLAGAAPTAAEAAARAWLDRVGLSHRARHLPRQLSGGEMQRAAIARALVHEPALIVADEPTGNLDSENGARILALLAALNRDTGTTMLIATHDKEVAGAAHRVVTMRDGRIERQVSRALD